MVSYPSSFYGPALLLLVPEHQCVCVATEWLRSRKNSGYKRIFAGFFFFQTDQIPNSLHVPATHSNNSQGVKMKLWNISTAVRRGDITGFVPCKILLPRPKYQQNLLYISYTQILFNAGKFPTVMNAITALNPSLQRGRDFSYRTWICQRHKSFLGRIMDLGVHWKSHFGKAIQ